MAYINSAIRELYVGYKMYPPQNFSRPQLLIRRPAWQEKELIELASGATEVTLFVSRMLEMYSDTGKLHRQS